jgi:hypothetical protein
MSGLANLACASLLALPLPINREDQPSPKNVSTTLGARMEGPHARQWLRLLLLATLAVTIHFYTPRTMGRSTHYMRWNLRQWHFGRYETQESVEGVDMDDGTLSSAYTYMVKGYRVGPLDVFTVGR